jgi:Tol biopolymer transport system component
MAAAVAAPSAVGVEPDDALRRVTVASDGTEGDRTSLGPALSGDGHLVVFASDATNLVDGDENRATDVFVHDRSTGTNTRVSVSSDGTEGDLPSFNPAISGDGRLVAFASDSTNLVPDDTNGVTDVFVHDLAAHTTTRVSVAPDGTGGDGASFIAALDGDGRHVAFASHAANLAPGDANGTGADVFVRDLAAGVTSRVSVASDGTAGDRASLGPALSGDGRLVAFFSDATNLVAGDSNEASDVFVHDRETGTTTRVSVTSEGGEGAAGSFICTLSGDGRLVAFASQAWNLVPDDTNGASDVFLHDRATGATTRVSLADDGRQARADSHQPVLSGDGRFVTFRSDAWNLVPDDTNVRADVFLRDLSSGTVRRLSVTSQGGQADRASFSAVLGAGGTVAAFASDATNLVDGDGNSASDVFVRDLAPG